MAVVAIVFGVYASSSYGQETSTTDDTAQANPLPPAAYVDAGEGYKIGGTIMLTRPGRPGLHNTAVGAAALVANTTGSDNTASGLDGLQFNTTGNGNTAIGLEALQFNTTGNGNTAIGLEALQFNTTGNDNTATGIDALVGGTGSSNSAFGRDALVSNMTGRSNSALGYYACTGVSTANNVICIGADTSNTTYIAGIAGVTLPTAAEPLVCIDPPTGQLGTVNCAANGMIEALQKQNEELQQRVARLEALVAKK
jgi:hypothetical protein